jgi:hypothetical protein
MSERAPGQLECSQFRVAVMISRDAWLLASVIGQCMIVSHLYYDNGIKAIKMIRNDFDAAFGVTPGLKESKDDIDDLLGRWPR